MGPLRSKPYAPLPNPSCLSLSCIPGLSASCISALLSGAAAPDAGLGSFGWRLPGGSWVVIIGVISRVAIVITQI